jgi:hypothetical protein
MSDIRDIIAQFHNANLSIHVDGPPNYDSGRVIIRGDSHGFQFLARVLGAMADTVSDANHPASTNGWQLVLSPRDVPQLEMDNSNLALDCDPQHRVPPLRG